MRCEGPRQEGEQQKDHVATGSVSSRRLAHFWQKFARRAGESAVPKPGGCINNICKDTIGSTTTTTTITLVIQLSYFPECSNSVRASTPCMGEFISIYEIRPSHSQISRPGGGQRLHIHGFGPTWHIIANVCSHLVQMTSEQEDEVLERGDDQAPQAREHWSNQLGHLALPRLRI